MSPQTRNLLYIVAVVVIIIIIGLIAWFLYSRPHASLPTSTATSTNPFAGSTSASPIADTQAPATHLTENGTYYNVDLQYPSSTALLQSGGSTADTLAVTAMKTFAQNTADTFIEQNDLSTMTAQQAQKEGILPGQAYTLSDSYQFYSSPTTISYVFTLSEDTLGAHPNTYYQTFTFDAKTGKQVPLSDLFSPGSNYLSELSTISDQMLTAQLGANGDPDSIAQGTAPTADNFQSFALDGSNLDIFFPPYQVAAYAYGSQEVKIPLSQLQSILNLAY